MANEPTANERPTGREFAAPTGCPTCLHVWWVLPTGQCVGLMIPGGEPVDALLHAKEALEAGALSVTIMREIVKSGNDGGQRRASSPVR